MKEWTAHLYQLYMMQFMFQMRRCNLFAGMGMGKTTAVLTVIDALFLSGEETKPALVIAPLKVAASTWPAEAKKWRHLRHLRVIPLLGNPTQRKDALRIKADVYTINYENIEWLVSQFAGREWPFGIMVADESTKLKSFRLRGGGVRAAALAKIAWRATRWINLTGTPAPNGLANLWGQMWFIDKGQRLGRTHGAFESRWFNRIQIGASPQGVKIEPRPAADTEIQNTIKDVSYSLEAKDFFDIDDPIVIDIPVKMPAKALAQYKEMEKLLFLQIENEEIEAMGAAARTLKCLQLASGAIYLGEDNKEWAVTHDEKLFALEQIIENANGAPVLVAYHFKSDLARLLKYFPQGKHLDKDPKTIDLWNAEKIPVMFAHPQSAGHGLNLQDGGNILVFFSHWWDLEQYQQIVERIGPTRQMQAGHPRPVYVYHLIAEGTVDAEVVKRRDGKITVQEALMEAMKRDL